MALGISTACFYPEYTENALRFLGESGVKLVEIFFNAECELSSYFIGELNKIKNEYGMKICAVHPYSSAMEPYLLFSDYDRRFNDARKLYNRMFEAAAELGASFVTLHGDRPFGRLPVEGYCERYSYLFEDAEGFGVTLNQENVAGFRSAEADFLRDMAEILKDRVAFTLDIKQCIRAGYTPLEIIAAMGNGIKHVHISDHSAAGDCLLPGCGGFDFKNFFDFMAKNGYKGDYIVEVYNNAYSDKIDVVKSLCNIYE